MTLKQAAAKFKVAGLDSLALKNQDEAFQRCLTFLDGIEKRRTLNRSGDSLKHIVENPSGRFGVPSSQDFYTGYVYEGTFVLAALASGFTAQPIVHGSLKSWFNISQRGIRRRVIELTRR
jgi:hypothetical protein